MLRLGSTNLIYDSCVCREAETLGKGNEVVVLDIVEGRSQKREDVRNFKVERIKLYTKKLPKKHFFWAIKYAEYLLWTCIKAISKKADVYHAHNLHCVIPAYIAAKVNKTKVVYDSHELYTEASGMGKALKVVWKFVERILITRVDQVIAANEFRARIMRDEYGAPELPTVIVNCPPLEEIYPTKKLPEYLEQRGVKEKKIVLYQGALCPGRCLEDIVKSAKYLSDNIVIVFMGYGKLGDKLVAIARNEGVEDKVFFHDAVPADNLLSYTASTHLGIVTYKNTCRNNYYCAPDKLFEYIMAGIPVAGCDFPEVARIVNKYEIGELFDPEDVKSIENAINHIFEDKERYDRMKRNTQLARNTCNWGNEKKKLLQLYEELKRP